MRLNLLWRMILPTVLLSLLLLAVGLGAAVYVYASNSRVSERLDQRVAEVLTAEELVLAIRDVRLELDRYATTSQPEFFSAAEAAAIRAKSVLATLIESGALPKESQLVHETQTLSDLVVALKEADRGEFPASRLRITQGPLRAASEFLKTNREAVTEQSRQNRQLAGRVGTSLALLGLCGSAAGLLAGFGVARGIASSIAELGGSLQSLSASLAAEAPVGPAAGLPELIAAMSQVRMKTEGIVSELERSRETAARADQLAAVGQLAAGIAHELRNPLTAVKLLTESALEHSEGLSGQELAVVRDEVDRMQQMLQTFLDFARPPKLARRRVRLDEIARQISELTTPRAQRLDVAIRVDAPTAVEIDADPQQLKQVLLNLVINAIDAQPAGGQIDVTVHCEGDSAVVDVADRGPGIANEVAERLFEPFVSTKETGVGLGLAVSQRIAASHGGRILADDRPGGGALFRVELPRRIAAPFVTAG